MARFKLGPDEFLLMHASRVRRQDGKNGGTDELVLTNRNLIIIDRGLLGAAELEYLPLSQLKAFEGKPQAFATQNRHGQSQLEVFFIDRHEVFLFQSGGRHATVKWADAIVAAASGRAVDVQKRATMALPGIEAAVETLRDSVSQVARTLRGRKA